ncbi:hypothetical protein CNMCM5793_002990 [Aspergillus hiratsukae]|uniref:SCP domain-containing protein n=1 Tax=Aspergillus hiratsukae TaxID=1194566 RepID=A0A8H6P0X7_9EURO|nr:hypothetical protein CNMCM5793_002990 [Aspergillus hiratsukae]KAF7155280.1 hypothetical protein CNMCM6106_002735 [Aspergillus hiratsukae]
MRYSWLIGAVCAAGAMAKPIDKRAYVIDWTIVTVTETITLPSGPEPTPTPAYSPIQAVQLTQTVASVDPAPAPAPVDTEAKSVAPVPTPAAPVGKVEELPGASAWSTAWTSTWTSAWTSSVPEAAPPTTLATSTPTPGPAAPATNAYQSAVLYNHNIHRSNHSASSMTWNTTLESSAYDLASQCVYQHNTDIGGGGYGQNIGYGVSADEVGVMITNLMYNDEFAYFDGLYGEANPNMAYFEKWGHFSQIVWKGSVSVGCATVVCDSLGNVDSSAPSPFTVCNYYPPGNYAGEYGDNVLPPLGHAYYSA